MTERAEQGLVPPNRIAIPSGFAVSGYENVAGLLLASLTLLGAVTLVMLMIWVGSKVTVTLVAVPVMLDGVPDPQGGFENGLPGETIEIAGVVTGDLGRGDGASEETLRQTLETFNGVMAVQQPLLDDLAQREPWSTGREGGSRGNGHAPPIGIGGGPGGVQRHLRWIIDYAQASSLELYAAQLDQFGIELGAIGEEGPIAYASKFSSPSPQRREGPKGQEKRLNFSWHGGELQQADRQLLLRAGIDSSGKEVLQFYSQETEELLVRLEAAYLNERAPPHRREISLVKQTRFGVRGNRADGFLFFVKSQTYLGNL